MAPATGGIRREAEAGGEGSKLQQAVFESGLLGLAAPSTAITLAVCEPPPLGLDKTTYLLSLSGVFFAGVTQVAASVLAPHGAPHAAGRKLVYACLVAPVVVAAGGLTVWLRYSSEFLPLTL